jgi:RNA polymerase sigma-70 factor (ECF subfamily)
MDETALIKRAKSGDVSAYNRLVLHYQDLAYNVALRIMKDPPAAEDMTQEGFVSAYQALHQFRGGSFKSWLLRIVTNKCYDELRRYKRRPQSSLDELTEDNESFPALRSDVAGPERARQQEEMMQAVSRCLDELPESQRTAAVLCDVEGFDYKEIADVMSVSLGTVKSRISRARRKLRDCLRGMGELLPADYRLTDE